MRATSICYVFHFWFDLCIKKKLFGQKHTKSKMFDQIKLLWKDLNLEEQPFMLCYLSYIFKNKPAAQVAGADPFQYNFPNRKNPPVQ